MQVMVDEEREMSRDMSREMPRDMPDAPMLQELGGYVTANRAAELLDIKLGQVYWAIKHEKFRRVGRLDGRTWLIKKTSVERYKRERERLMTPGYPR